jgi:hypothetical protein
LVAVPGGAPRERLNLTEPVQPKVDARRGQPHNGSTARKLAGTGYPGTDGMGSLIGLLISAFLVLDHP